MNRRVFAMATLFGLLLVSPAAAHDPSQHKGRQIRGEVVSAGADRLEMKTADGKLVVTFTDKTKFEHSNQQVTREHVKPGTKVAVIGTKLPTGELVAKEILLMDGESHKKH